MPDRIDAALTHPGFAGYIEGALCRDAATVQSLLDKTKRFAVAPISNFQVAALAFGATGRIYLGANMEFRGVPLHASLHAEQSAVLNAWMHGERGIRKIVVSEIPCGHCRQFLCELPDADALVIETPVKKAVLAEWLPNSFGFTECHEENLLNHPSQNFLIIDETNNDFIDGVVDAANQSYAPYSGCHEGIVLKTQSGACFYGRNAECVAFNPSVPAITTALNQKNLSSNRDETIEACVLTRLEDDKSDSLTFSQAVLNGICGVKIELAQLSRTP